MGRAALAIALVALSIFVLVPVILGAITYTRGHYYPRLKSREVMVGDCYQGKKIDCVVLWVDGSDPVWQEKFKKAVGLESLDQNRYNCQINEIRWCVQQARIQPWIDRIFIVTDEQKHNISGVTWVDHSDIFPEYVKRPCFNSSVIETYIHRIPTLSETFLYLNDDMIFTKPLPKNFFELPSGQLRLFASDWGVDARLARAATLGSETVSLNLMNSDSFFREKYKVPTLQYLSLGNHGPTVCSVSGMTQLLEDIGEERLRQDAQFQTRDASNLIVTQFLWKHYASLKKMGVWTNRSYNCEYIWLNNSTFINGIQLRRLRHVKPDVICINDSRTANFDETSKKVVDWLQSHIPLAP